MCYNVSIIKDAESLEKRFDAKFESPGTYEPKYHASGFSTPHLPIISNEDIHLIQLFRWGLIPYWVKDNETAGKIRFKTLNARSETIHEKPSFKHAIENRRCLVMADGFYEWREFEGKKYPYFIRLVTQDSFALAGIWDSWENRETGIPEKTFSIITTQANPLMEVIHNTRKRMPVILKREDEKTWLSDSLTSDEIDFMLGPYDEKQMEAYTVSRLIASRGKNTNLPEAIKKYEYPELETI